MSEHDAIRQTWEESFDQQIRAGAFNTSAVEALVRNASYWLREARPDGDCRGLRFLEVGCGAGPNLAWLAAKGVRVSGLDISPTALGLCRENLRRAGLSGLIDELAEGSADALPFPDASFDGVFEACVFQHLPRTVRLAAFAEVGRVLKPGGLFCGYMLGRGHTLYQSGSADQDPADPGTLVSDRGGSKLYISNIGLCHYFSPEEIRGLLPGFAVVNPCAVDYDLPAFEAEKRGFPAWRQAMWAVYAVK